MAAKAYCLASPGDTAGRRPGASVWPTHEQADAARMDLPLGAGRSLVVRPLELPRDFAACTHPYERPDLVTHPMWVLDVAVPSAGTPGYMAPEQPKPANDPAMEGFL